MAIKVKGQIVIDDNQNIISSGIATATNFKTGTTNVHNAGIEVSGINVLGADTPIGSNATIFDDGNATFGGNVEALSLTISGVPVNTSTQVDEKIAALETSLTDGAPGALNTLNELAASLGDDANFASTMTNLIATKANTSSLATVATTGSYNDLINKPTLGTAAATASSAYATAAQGAKADTALQASNLVPYDTSAQVTAKIAALETSLTDGAPGALNTLNELAASLGDDANFASTMTNLIATKADTSSLATVATTGSYTNLSNKPFIPTHTSHITNNSGFITNSGGTTGATGNTVVKRDGSADIHCRLLRPNYGNQSNISGAIAFRTNNSSDNYVRFCSDTAAIRTFLNVPTRTGGNASGTWGINITGSAGSASSATNATNASYLRRNGSSTPMTFHWNGQSGQPTYLWGSNDGTNVYVWNPSNFNVNYATSAGSASSCSGNAASASTVTINYNNNSNSTYQMLWGSGNSVYGTGGIYCNPATNWIYSTSIYVSDWLRTTGSSGWYNQSYAGGMTMQDTTWVRVYNNKALYVSNQIAATGNVTAYYSDIRLKEKLGDITNALDKVCSIDTLLYKHNDLAKSYGYEGDRQQIGVSAQSVKKVCPEVIDRAPFDIETHETDGTQTSKSGEDYMTVNYGRLVPLLIESIKELKAEVETLKQDRN